jgi:tetratricopeptide (TPR) repeat protein
MTQKAKVILYFIGLGGIVSIFVFFLSNKIIDISITQQGEHTQTLHSEMDSEQPLPDLKHDRATDKTKDLRESEPVPIDSGNTSSVEDIHWVEDIHDDLYSDLLPGPFWFDIVSYLRADKLVQKGSGSDLKPLVHSRYDLRSRESTELAITDLYELTRLWDGEFYKKHWPKGECLSFVDAAVDTILEMYPDNASAMLIKSLLILEQSHSVDEAFSVFKKACEVVVKNNDSYMYTDLVSVATRLMSSNQMNSTTKAAVKELVYGVGVPKNCPLADYMEGRPSEVSLTKQCDTVKNPFNLQNSKSFAEKYNIPLNVTNTESFNPASLSPLNRLKYWNVRARCLLIEKSARGLVSFVQTFPYDAPEVIKMCASASAFTLAGRRGQAAHIYEHILSSVDKYNEHVPDLHIKMQWELGEIYYEQGSYQKAEEAFRGVVANAPSQKVLAEALKRLDEIAVRKVE